MVARGREMKRGLPGGGPGPAESARPHIGRRGQAGTQLDDPRPETERTETERRDETRNRGRHSYRASPRHRILAKRRTKGVQEGGSKEPEGARLW